MKWMGMLAAGLVGLSTVVADEPVPQIELPTIEGPKPWNERPVLNDPNKFTFAVMTDNTGGHRPGIWLKGIRHLNLLRPEFVVSVGDLIEGYTTNRDQIESQWKAFLAEMDEIDMRFFFVPGNHDLSNPVMHEVWREKFGREWYSFDYLGVHFVCLSSEDPQETHLSDEQVAWATEDLAKHADARWTFVFMHKPLWVSAERAISAGNADPTNWSIIEEKLKSRPHTVFAGHVHHYVQYDRNGTHYYHLATTGGGSQLRGVSYGEFDQVTLVSMEADGPHIAHVLLGGVLAPDAVTEKGIARFRQFLSKAIVRVHPVLGGENDSLTSGKIQIQVANEFDTPIRLRASILNLPLRGLTLTPAGIEFEAKPGTEETLDVEYSFSEPVSIDLLRSASLTATIQSVEDVPLTAEVSLPITIDRRLACPMMTKVTVDGNLDEWKLEHETGKRPLMFGDTKNWNGVGDGSLSFALGRDEKNLYFAGRVTDDRVEADGDRLYLRLDARPLAERIAEPEYAKGCYRLETGPAGADGPLELAFTADAGGKVYAVESSAYRKTEGGYEVELAIPLANLNEAQGGDWSTFQFSAGLADVDGTDGPTYIVWRGSPDILERNTNFAHFEKKN